MATRDLCAAFVPATLGQVVISKLKMAARRHTLENWSRYIAWIACKTYPTRKVCTQDRYQTVYLFVGLQSLAGLENTNLENISPTERTTTRKNIVVQIAT